MKKTIWKYPLKTDDIQTIQMPKGANILTIQELNNNPVLWAIVNPNELIMEGRVIEIFGTGNPLPECIASTRKYIGTYQVLNGQFCGHVFEYLNKEPLPSNLDSDQKSPGL